MLAAILVYCIKDNYTRGFIKLMFLSSSRLQSKVLFILLQRPGQNSENTYFMIRLISPQRLATTITWFMIWRHLLTKQVRLLMAGAPPYSQGLTMFQARFFPNILLHKNCTEEIKYYITNYDLPLPSNFRSKATLY